MDVPSSPLPRDPTNALILIEKALHRAEKSMLVIDSAHLLAPSSIGGSAVSFDERAVIERLRTWADNDVIRNNHGLVLLVTDQAGKISQELRVNTEGVRTVFIPKPNSKDRQAFLEALVSDFTNGTFSLGEDWDLPMAVVATQGMNLRQIRDIFLEARQAEKPVDLRFINAKKIDLLNAEYGDVMEVVRPERGLDDIGGHEHIKAYLREVLQAIRTGETRLVPMGITLMGPPGTGKSALGEALAYEAGFAFVKLRQVRSKWMGESESNNERAIAGLKAMAPVVVIKDEADLNDAERDGPQGDSGVSNRIMKAWMEFLSDPRIRGQVVMISCTNRPDRIDPALKRSGRSDERVLVAMPSLEERKVIFSIMFKRHKIPTSISVFDSYALRAENFSGADIERLVLNSWRFAFARNNASVDKQALEEALDDFITSANQGEIDFMTMSALLESSSRRLLPINVKEIVKEIAERKLLPNLDYYLEQLSNRSIIKTD